MMLHMFISACTVTDMEQDALIPVDLDQYREQLDKQGTKLAAARRKLELSTDVLKATVQAAVQAGISKSEAARLAGVRRETVIEWCGK